jgi:nicotinate-nucleotide adenylyltransferase
MNIGLYFGSFNPIHTGHCIIANHVAQNSDVDQVWLIVSPQNPFKPSASLLNEYHRLHLAQLATEGENKLKVSDIEFHLPRPSYTIDTMTYLAEKYPGHQFSIILGSDSLQNLHKWKNAEVLTERYAFHVYLRPEFDVINPLQATLKVLEAPLLQISSTQIRELIKKDKSIRYLVPDKVREEIELYRYYK